MTRFFFLKFFIPVFSYLVLIAATSSCVSVGLKQKAADKSKSYSFTQPSGNFEKIKSVQADLAFQDPTTGHTIAMISECSDSLDPSIESLESEITSSIQNAKAISQTEVMTNSRSGRHSLFSGTMDGVPVNIEILVFKKSSCAYTLTLMGREKGFENQRKYFENFKKGFKAE